MPIDPHATRQSQQRGHPTKVVPDDCRVQDEASRDTGLFLRSIALPVNEVLDATAAASQVQDPPGSVDRTTVDDLRRRRDRTLGRQRIEMNSL